MKRFFFSGFSLLMIFDTFAQICFKFTATDSLPLTFDRHWLFRILSNPWVYGAIIGYICTFFTWITLLKRLSIGASFAASHLEVVSVLILSVWIFNEPMTLAKFWGALLILGGIFCLAIAEEKISHETR